MTKFFPLLLLLFANFGCASLETVESTRIPQSEIQQNYHVSADRNGTRVAAVFYHGDWGKTVDLDAPSSIAYNNRELPEIAPNFLKGTTYGIDFDEFRPRHEFIYTNGDGEVFRNQMSFEAIDLSAAEISISRRRNTIVPLSRRVREDEEISIRLSSLAERPETNLENANSGDADKTGRNLPGFDLSLHDELDEARTAIVLKPKNLKNFVAGKAVLKIETSRRLALQQATAAGGSLSWTYVSTIEARVEN